MHSRAPRMLLLATAALTAGSVAYAVLTLPEPGDLRQPVVPSPGSPEPAGFAATIRRCSPA
jgi:hypothetical protein